MAFEFKLPDIGEGVVEGEIIRWLIQPGDIIKEDQPMVEVMTDKATVEIPSPVEGKVLDTIGAEGEVVEVGSTLVVIETDGEPAAAERQRKPQPPEMPAPASPPAVEKPQERGSRKVLATPAVRKMARELSVDLSRLEGSGRGGRITREDVEKFVHRSAEPSPRSAPAPAAGASAAPDLETIPYRGLRKKIGDHLVAAKRFAPHYTYVEEVDATQLVQLRTRYRQLNPESQLTYLPFLIKSVVEGLRKYPLLNSTLDEERQVIQLKKSYNIGVAAATAEGLIVPVIKHADRKSILELSQEVTRLSEQSREGRIQLEDLRDGTFTITSLGFLGGVLATPIINYPEVGILGVHKIQQKPVVRDGSIVVRHMMNLSLSLDHRVVDGAVGAEFLHTVISYLENPGLLSVV